MSGKNEKKIETAPHVLVTNIPNRLSPRRRRVQLHCGHDSLTEQAHKKECDINHIVAKYSGDELRELMSKRPAIYADFASAPSYQEAVELLSTAQQQFDALPSKVRREFDNDPKTFLAFASDAKNAKRLVELGLASERPKSDPPASRSDIEKLGKALSAPKKEPGETERK